MTAMETMKEALRSIQQAQAECITEEGVVKNHSKYKYQELTQKAKEFSNSIKWWEENMMSGFLVEKS